jgi:hypothetical protein
MKTMTPTLRQIEEDIQALDNLLEELGGDVSDEEAEAAIDLWLQQNQKNLRQKLNGYLTLIKARERMATFRKEEADRLKGLAVTDTNVFTKLKGRLLDFFLRHPDLGSKMDTGLYKVSVAGNGGKTPVEIKDGITAEGVFNSGLQSYVRVSYELDMEAIRQDLEQGVSIPFATLGVRGRHLRIK